MVEKKANGGVTGPGRPAQSSLKVMEDRALEELEAKAEEYAEIRDERMRLTQQESDLNDELLVLMKKHKKPEYHHGDVHCWIKATDERVKVKIGDITPKQRKKESGEVSTAAKLKAEADDKKAEVDSVQ